MDGVEYYCGMIRWLKFIGLIFQKYGIDKKDTTNIMPGTNLTGKQLYGRINGIFYRFAATHEGIEPINALAEADDDSLLSLKCCGKKILPWIKIFREEAKEYIELGYISNHMINLEEVFKEVWTDEMERKAQIKAQIEIGNRVMNGEKLTKQDIQKILTEKRKEVAGK